MMQETVSQFGSGNRLTGILTRPSIQLEVPDAPVAVILNAGIVHRIGPFRLHVDIARKLAERGFSTLRLDLSGLGDSLTRQGKLPTEGSRSLLDVNDALSHLTDHLGKKQFVLMGLCSGAYNAHQVAVQDDRVVGSVFLDGIVFRTFRFYWHHYFLRYFKLRFWRNAMKRRLNQRFKTIEKGGQSLAESEFFGGDINRTVVRNELKKMLERNMRMLFIYTESYDDIASREQFQEMYGLKPSDQLQVEYYRNTTHTFRLTENRETVCRRISDWYQSQFSSI